MYQRGLQSGYALAATKHDVRAKLSAGMHQTAAGKPTDTSCFAQRLRTGIPDYDRWLRAAISNRRVFTLAKADGAGLPGLRRVCPLAVRTFLDCWMLSGRCALGQDFRSFCFDRFTGLAATDEIFADDPETGQQAFLAREYCDGHGARALTAAP